MNNASKRIPFINATALAINLVVGSGIVGLLGIGVSMGGPVKSVLAWAIAGVSILPCLVVFYSLKNASGNDSVFQYAGRQLGGWAQQGIHYLLLGTGVLIIPAIAILGASQVATFLELSDESLFPLSLLILLFGAAINLMGRQYVGVVARLSSFVLFSTVALVVLFHFELAMLGFDRFFEGIKVLSTKEVGGTWQLCSILFFAFIGWESLSLCRKDLSQPRRFPLIYLVSFLVVVSIYAGLSLVFAGASLSGYEVQGVAGFLSLLRPLPFGQGLITGIALVICGNISAWMMGVGNMLQNAGEQGVLSPALAQLNRRQSPYVGLAFVTLLSAVVSFVLFKNSIPLSSVFPLVNQNFIFIYLMCFYTYWKHTQSGLKYVIVPSGSVALTFLAMGFSWQIVYPVTLFAIGVMTSPQLKSISFPKMAARLN